MSASRQLRTGSVDPTTSVVCFPRKVERAASWVLFIAGRFIDATNRDIRCPYEQLVGRVFGSRSSSGVYCRSLCHCDASAMCAFHLPSVVEVADQADATSA